MNSDRVRAVLAIVLIVYGACAAAQVVNPDFDTGREGWSFYLDAGAGGVVDWTGDDGFPEPGAALVANGFPSDRRDGLRQCLPAEPGQPLLLQVYARAQMPDGNRCSARLIFVDTAGCMAGAGIVSELHVWTGPSAGWTLLDVGAIAPFATEAVVVDLSHERIAAAGTGSSICLFDHVRLGPDLLFDSGFE